MGRTLEAVVSRSVAGAVGLGSMMSTSSWLTLEREVLAHSKRVVPRGNDWALQDRRACYRSSRESRAWNSQDMPLP